MYCRGAIYLQSLQLSLKGQELSVCRSKAQCIRFQGCRDQILSNILGSVEGIDTVTDLAEGSFPNLSRLAYLIFRIARQLRPRSIDDIVVRNSGQFLKEAPG